MDIQSLVNIETADNKSAQPFSCNYCPMRFTQNSDRSRHERSHTDDQPHVCEYLNCGKRFTRRSALTVHMRTHTSKKPHMCERCGKPFSNSSSLVRHRQIHSGERPYKCPYAHCQKTFAQRTSLTRHQNHHTGTVEEPAVATAAALATCAGSNRDRRQHSDRDVQEPPSDRAVEKSLSCSVCKKGFTRKSDIVRHERIHSGIRPYVCKHPGCGKQFIQNPALTVHMRLHTGEKPHKCKECGKLFGDPASFTRHCRIHLGKRPYQCPYANCQHTFTRLGSLTYHQKRHTGTVEEAAAVTAAALATLRGSNDGGRQHADGAFTSTPPHCRLENIEPSRPQTVSPQMGPETGDGGYNSASNDSDTQSIDPSLLEFVWENQRRYHSKSYGGPFWAPNDDNEQYRMMLSHAVWSEVLGGKLTLTPVSNPQKVLDIGTGTGLWPMDFAGKYSSAKVSGIDITPIQSDWVLENVQFEMDDINSSPYEAGESIWDLIHVREMEGGVKNWPDLLSKWFMGIKHGGWIELAGHSIRLKHDDLVLSNWTQTIVESGTKSGMEFEVANKFQGWLVDTGFINIQEFRFTVPVGPHDQRQIELGRLNQLRLVEGIQSYCRRPMIETLGRNFENVLLNEVRIRKSLKETPNLSQDFVIVIGQKPPGL